MVDSEAWRGKVGGMSEAEANEFLRAKRGTGFKSIFNGFYNINCIS